MKSKPSRKKLEQPFLDPAKRKHQILSYTVPIEVDHLTEDLAGQLGLEPAHYIQCAICDANSRVIVMHDPEEGDHRGGVLGRWIEKAVQEKRLQEGKPAEQKPRTVEVTIELPRAFATRMEEKCETDSITLAEAIGDLAREGLSQQFDDPGIELEMVRRITSARNGEAIQ
jgi:hypothetical protein